MIRPIIQQCQQPNPNYFSTVPIRVKRTRTSLSVARPPPTPKTMSHVTPTHLDARYQVQNCQAQARRPQLKCQVRIVISTEKN